MNEVDRWIATLPHGTAVPMSQFLDMVLPATERYAMHTYRLGGTLWRFGYHKDTAQWVYTRVS